MTKSQFITTAKKANKEVEKVIPTFVLIYDKPVYRMKSFGPVQLLKLGNYRLIDIQIQAIKTYTADPEIVICGGFDINRVARYIKEQYPKTNIRVLENQVYDESGCCESLRLCLNNINAKSLWVANGSALLFPELTDIKCNESYILSRKNEKRKTNLEVGSVCNENGIVTNFSYGLHNIWSEIFFLSSADHIERLRKIVSSELYKNKFIFEALNEFTKNKYNFRQIMMKEPFYQIRDVKTYYKIRDKYEGAGMQLFIRSFN